MENESNGSNNSDDDNDDDEKKENRIKGKRQKEVEKRKRQIDGCKKYDTFNISY